ncbi:RNA polymerase sigma factor [Aquimarina longa]|uniref:RNA polymerase sigma factor n=1 Tax=Aquimarina longa TaxID=1080221 RepID=UPI000785EBB5|nr:sigma-70 family RNA polymerase sigma factor [Aquimarina longa]
MKGIKDQEILQGILTGDTAVIKDFYKENFKYIRGYILQSSGNKEDVEDVFQDALVVLYQKLESDSLELNVALRTYFFAICKNLWKKRLQKKSKLYTTDTIFDISEELDIGIVEMLENKEREHIYRKYFLKLSEACQKLLSMVFEEKSMRQIASETGYSEGYARKKKFECKKHLMERIESDPIYEELKVHTPQKKNRSYE